MRARCTLNGISIRIKRSGFSVLYPHFLSQAPGVHPHSGVGGEVEVVEEPRKIALQHCDCHPACTSREGGATGDKIDMARKERFRVGQRTLASTEDTPHTRCTRGMPPYKDRLRHR